MSQDTTDAADAWARLLAPFEAAVHPYWDAAAAGQLLLQQCAECGERFHYPRPFCPFCGAGEVAWVESRGEGTVYSYTTVTLGRAPPTTIALVTLEEGPTVPMRLAEGATPPRAIGDRVAGRFQASAGRLPVLTFAPA